MIPESKFLKKEMIELQFNGRWKAVWKNIDGYITERFFFTKEIAISFINSLPKAIKKN